MPVNVVWFKRDLRLADNAALNEAVNHELPIICLFNLDRARIDRDDVSGIHLEWELDCLRLLSNEVAKLGGIVKFNVGDVVAYLDKLHHAYEINSVICHQETGLDWSWKRDRAVAKWCQINKVDLSEHPSNGVIRRLDSRDNWKNLRDQRIRADPLPKPLHILAPDNCQSDEVPSLTQLGLTTRRLVNRPQPGEAAALETLKSFLEQRGRDYRKGMSSPLTGAWVCSRISPYLSVGCLSIKQVVNHTSARQKQIKKAPRASNNRGFSSALTSFHSRLAWHCHFMQRLEVEATMDEIALNPELDKLLERRLDQRKFIAWRDGRTGWPFFDACMRYLTATGWINFRMRAMLQSVASYTLWLPWQVTGRHLANLFLDYEPGIHWSQVQMQSGVTGINTVRAYSVAKQSTDQDPKGDFIRRWVPELSKVPVEHIHQPWLMSNDEQYQYGCRIDIDYPSPIVDEKSARKLGISKSYSAKSNSDVKQRAKIVFDLHGSRSRQTKRR